MEGRGYEPYEAVRCNALIPAILNLIFFISLHCNNIVIEALISYNIEFYFIFYLVGGYFFPLARFFFIKYLVFLTFFYIFALLENESSLTSL